MANVDVIKILGSLLNSGALSRGSGSNVLGSVIGALAGGGQSPGARSSGGSLGDLVGGMLGGGGSGGGQGSMGDLLGGLLGGGARSTGGGLGDLLGMAMSQFGASGQGGVQQVHNAARGSLPAGMDYHQAEQQAELLIRAMINAAKADGRVDSGEQQKILERLGEVSQDELAFVQHELSEPLDTDAFIRSVPRGMEQKVYAVSLMAIDLDTNPEARYMHELAQGFGLSADMSNQIHEQLGAPKLYR